MRRKYPCARVLKGANTCKVSSIFSLENLWYLIDFFINMSRKKLAGTPCISNNPNSSCHLVVTDPVTDGPQNLQLMQRWLPLHLMIRGQLLYCT